MDFFTHCWKSARPSLCAVLALAWALSGLAAPTPALAQAPAAPVEIVQLHVERLDEAVLLSAQVKFELSAAVEDALRKGIAVYFVAEAQLLRDRWYWYDKRLVTATRHMRLSYHPLTRRWRLTVTSGAAAVANPGIALNQNFESLPEALTALSHQSRWKIAEASELEPDARYNVDFSFRLDLSELPRPFQIGLLGQNDWTISAAKNQRLSMDAAR